jgi:alpha-1,3-rhamnosyl/mannosyltransferase
MMQRATALVFPSLLEGFGLPVLEGFASQTPVICSNTSSLPEVAADAAWLVDPLSQNAMTEAMHTLAQKPQVAYESVAKGLIRARNMSWDICAEKTFQVYERILGKS